MGRYTAALLIIRDLFICVQPVANGELRVRFYHFIDAKFMLINNNNAHFAPHHWLLCSNETCSKASSIVCSMPRGDCVRKRQSISNEKKNWQQKQTETIWPVSVSNSTQQGHKSTSKFMVLYKKTTNERRKKYMWATWYDAPLSSIFNTTFDAVGCPVDWLVTHFN